MVVRFIITIPILLYQKVVSPFLPKTCNYEPSCSEYSRRAILRFGIGKGIVAAVLRIGRCSARYRGGSDPLPDTFDVKSLIGEYRARSFSRRKRSG